MRHGPNPGMNTSAPLLMQTSQRHEGGGLGVIHLQSGLLQEMSPCWSWQVAQMAWDCIQVVTKTWVSKKLDVLMFSKVNAILNNLTTGTDD